MVTAEDLEDTPVADIKGVGSVALEKIADAGVSGMEDLVKVNTETLTDAGLSERKATKLKNRAEEESIIIKSGDDVVQKFDDKEYVSTGVRGLDNILGGGWEPGFVSCISGGSGGGKTQMTFQALISAVEQSGDSKEEAKPAVYIETEPGRYRPDRLQALSNEPWTQSQIHMVEAHDLDTQLKTFDKIMNNFTENEISMVAVDSFTARFRLSDKFENRGDLQSRSKLIGKHLTRLESLAGKLNIPAIITAQVYGNPGGYGAAEAMYGGSLMQHTVGCIVHMKQAQGALRKAHLQNHPGREDGECHIKIGGNEIKSVDGA